MGTITISSLIHRCLNWKNESLVLFLYSTVRTIGCRIQDQNNQVHNRLRNLVQARNLHQLLNQLQAIQLTKNQLNRLFEKQLTAMSLRRMEPHVIFLPRSFQQKQQQQLIVNQPSKKVCLINSELRKPISHLMIEDFTIRLMIYQQEFIRTYLIIKGAKLILTLWINCWNV